MASTREDFVFKASLAEKAGRRDDTRESIRQVAMLNVDLTPKEQALLNFSYKNSADERRTSLKILNCIDEGDDRRSEIIANYREKVESELSTICEDITALIDLHLIPHSTNEESKALYYRMKGDYFRYLLECNDGYERQGLVKKAFEAYEAAYEFANLSPANPTRLAVALNFSVFCYEIMNLPERGLKVAEDAIMEATAELDALDDQFKQYSTTIMQILKDNLTMWNFGKDKDNMEERDSCLTAVAYLLENLNPCRSRNEEEKSSRGDEAGSSNR